MSGLGDFALESTFDTKFTSRRFTTGAPFALVSGIISAYVGNSTTQLTAGITVTENFDGVTGLNNVRVVATAANGYAAASNYQLVITNGTVDNVSVVGEVIAEFSIENRVSKADVVKLLGTAWLTPAVAGTPDVNAKQLSGDATAADNAEAFFDGTGYAGTNNVIPLVTTATNLTNAPTVGDLTAAMISSVTTAATAATPIAASVTGAVGSVTGAVGSVTAAVTLPTIPTAWITADGVATDAVTEIQSGLATPTNITAGVITTVTNLTNAPTSGDLTATMKTSVTTAATASTPIAASVTGAVGSVTAGVTLAASAVQAIWDALTSALTTAGSIGKKLADWSIGTAQTGDSFARIGAAGAGLTALGDTRIANLDATVSSRATQTSADDLPTNAELATALASADDAIIAIVNEIPTNTELATALGTADDAILAILGTPAGVSMSADIAAIEAQTDDIGAAGAGLTALATQASVDDLPTNAELATSQAAADDATLAAIAALPTAGAIADQVWDEAISGHAVAGSTGEALSAASSAGDPWSTALPGAYGAGTAGKLVGDNVNATISSRASQASVDDVPTNAELSTALGTADDAVLTAIGDLPTNTELATALGTADDAILAVLGTPAGASMSADIAAIEAQTDDIGAAGAGLTALGDTRIANLDAAVSTRLATAGYTAPPTVGQVADQVWDETLADHLAGGSAGAGLNAAGSAGDPWATAIPGAYGAGTAGKIVGDNVNATVSSRSTYAGGAVASVTGNVGGDVVGTVASVVGAVGSVTGLTASNLDATITSRMATYAQPTGFLAATFPTDPADQSLIIAATNTILADTNAILIDTAEIGVAGAGLTNINLPNQTMDIAGSITGNLSGSVGSVSGAVGSVTGFTAANIATIMAKTDNLPSDPADQSLVIAATDAITAAIAALNNLSVAQVNAEADTALADVGVTLARMGALTDWIDGGRLDLILDARASQTSVDDLPTNAELATAIGTADDAALVQIALVKAKTDLLPSDPADQSLVIAATDAIIAAIADKTGYRLSAAGVNDVLRTALTESYAADGADMTVEQALHMIWSMLCDKAIVGTTLTTKKLNGTTAMTFTLAPSGTAPTSQARAT